MTLEAIGAPLPGESAILVSAAAAAAGELDIRAVFLTAFAGAVLGDNIGYLIGRRLGRPAIARYGARANSGAIMAQYFQGFSEAMAGKRLLTASNFSMPCSVLGGKNSQLK